jgi:hypothetical protein
MAAWAMLLALGCADDPTETGVQGQGAAGALADGGGEGGRDAAADGSGEAGGSAGAAGKAGGGAGGKAGGAGSGGAAGAAGAGGTGGTAGTGGAGGKAGSAGWGGASGSAGASGAAGSAGTAGSAGGGGSGGASGTAGSAGAGGKAGGGGSAGAAGSSGGAGSGGAGGAAGSGGSLGASKLSALWANEGGDKVARDELRASKGKPVANSVFDGQTVKLFAARNETVSFVLVLEAATQAATGVSVTFDTLTGPGGASIKSKAVTADGVFDWVGRPIELFHVRYLPIKGLSKFGYIATYDERHVPIRLRRPWTGQGIGTGGWADRPDHDKEYPEIAVPLELAPSFGVAAGRNQSIWADVYVPKTAPAGVYAGTVTVREGGVPTRLVPVSLTVRSFALPDRPSSRTMLAISDQNVNRRHVGVSYPNPGTPEDQIARKVRKRHDQVAHRHGVALVGDTSPANADHPGAEWVPRLNGTLYTAAEQYAGRGESTGNDLYSIGTYGSWGWQSGTQQQMWSHADAWVKWFDANAPAADYFLYLIDESSNYAQIEQWSSWLHANPGVGKKLRGFATIDLRDAVAHTPSLDIAATTMYVGDTPVWSSALATWKASPARRFYMYNGHRPASGSFSTEDDGVALRELPWGQYKKGIDRWFFWESTYYDDYQSGRGQTDLFHDAQTFGPAPHFDTLMGMTSGTFSNGDGVLFYPGTDKIFPADSYGVQGPFASLRLKHWRRGIQDVDYVVLAAAADAAKTKAIVDGAVPKALWEYGVNDPNDPTWVRTDISWSVNPDAWEAARAKLADIIEGH